MQNEETPGKGRRSQVKCAGMRQTKKAGHHHTVMFLARQAREEVMGEIVRVEKMKLKNSGDPKCMSGMRE